MLFDNLDGKARIGSGYSVQAVHLSSMLSQSVMISVVFFIAKRGHCADCSDERKTVQALTTADQQALAEEECDPPYLAQVTTSDGDDQPTVCKILNYNSNEVDLRVEGTQQEPDPWLEVQKDNLGHFPFHHINLQLHVVDC